MSNSIPKIIYNNGTSDVEILFQYPPRGLDFIGQKIKAVQKVSESSNGGYQTSDNYLEDERNLSFRIVKESIKVLLDTFMLTHGLKGKSFQYFVHSDEVEFETLKISKRGRQFRPKRTGWNSEGDLTYEIKLKMRKVI